MFFKTSTKIKRVLLGSFFSICALGVFAPTTHAEFTVDDYQRFKGSTPEFEDYLIGLGRGIFWSNTVLVVQGSDPLFCMPNKLALDKGIILSVIDQEIRKFSPSKIYLESTPIELIAVRGFMASFPCD